MSTLLSRKTLPFWSYIVIIVVGSLIVLAIVAFSIRLCVLRRRAKQSSSQPIRRLTVRRGRVVPASHYLSLTGSKFGLGASDENRNRSRSPFEWWNNMLERSHSRLDDLSQAETASIKHDSSTSKSASFYNRNDLSVSTRSLPLEKGSYSTHEVDRMDGLDTDGISKHPSQMTEISKPPNARVSSQNVGHSRGLSRIEEASPHQSMTSALSKQRNSSSNSRIDVLDINSEQSNSTRPNIPSQKLSYFANSSIPSIREVTGQDDELESEISHPMTYYGSRSSLGEAVVFQSPQQHLSYGRNNDIGPKNFSRPTSKSTNVASEQKERSWGGSIIGSNGRSPSRTPSKKGNVLRKKSLLRAEMVSRIDA